MKEFIQAAELLIWNYENGFTDTNAFRDAVKDLKKSLPLAKKTIVSVAVDIKALNETLRHICKV